MYLTVIFLPALGSILTGLYGRQLGVKGSQLVTSLCIIVTTLLSIVAYYEVGLCNSPVTLNLLSWIDSEILDVSWGFLFDSLTVSILLPVLVVSSLVHLYSIDYINTDPHNQRFFSYLSIFTFFILILVTGDNYLIIFVGWEGIGISSYLLINFWFTRIQANKSAIKALVVNRVGDIFLSISFFAIFFLFGNIDYSTVFSLAIQLNEEIVSVVGVLVVLAAIGKSAQLGLHVWLPQAIEGPTPVSALIHAATLVTAGVYLLLRSSPILEYSPTTLLVITWVGAITAFFAASTGLLQNDLKRVIAYSTCSQIGYLFIACGLSNYNIALFHLINHAFFKALLFLAAGAVLHSTYDEQDLRRQGGLLAFLPFTYTSILIGSLSLMAVPFITGFYSKDLILEVAYGQYEFSGQIAYWVGTISACLTAFYSFRLISITFLTYPNASQNTYKCVHDTPMIVQVPLLILALLSVFFGYICKDLYVGIGSDFLIDSIFTHPNHIHSIDAENIPSIYKVGPIMGSFGAATIALYLYNKIPIYLINIKYSVWGQKVYKFFNGEYLIDIIYNNYVLYKGLYIGSNLSNWVERGVIEYVGPYGLSVKIVTISNTITKIDTGFITSYAIYITVSVIIILLICISPTISSMQFFDIRIILIIPIIIVLFPLVKSTKGKGSNSLIGKAPICGIVFISVQVRIITRFIFSCGYSTKVESEHRRLRLRL